MLALGQVTSTVQLCYDDVLRLASSDSSDASVSFSLPGDAPLSEQQETLTVVVQLASGAEQQTVLPVSFTVVAAETASPTPEPSPTLSL